MTFEAKAKNGRKAEKSVYIEFGCKYYKNVLLSKYYAIAILQIFQEVGVHRAVFEWPHHVRKREATYHAHILVLQEIL